MDVNIFIPDFWNFNDCHRIQGYIVERQNFLYLYICEKYSGASQIHKKCCDMWLTLNSTLILDGIICKTNSSVVVDSKGSPNFITLEVTNKKIHMKHLKINGAVLDHVMVRSVFVMLYNYASFLKSEYFSCDYEENVVDQTFQHCNQFDLLKNIIKHVHNMCSEKSIKSTYEKTDYRKSIFILSLCYNVILYLSKFSNLCMQLCSFTNSLKWISNSIQQDKKISVKVGNLMTSILIDLLSGLLILHFINRWTHTPVNELFDFIELIVDNLRSLLKWLMGSPAGLKLNHAFNTMLGKFFLYHIELWWMFLVITKSILELALNIFQYVGMLGITFQTAILADLLSLASFHIYCIYTYAARLYNIQISGLIAFWRLFLGRKHNPLRGGVDSCHYNHHQLFIGTLAFTILLFLLPTTFLYYVVFTSFRVLLVSLGGLLTWIRYIIQSLPLYLATLWIIRSKKIAGNIKMSLSPQSSSSKIVIFNIELQIASIFYLIKKYQPPPISQPACIKWNEIIPSLCWGQLLYPI